MVQGKTALALAAGDVETIQVISTHGASNGMEDSSSQVCTTLLIFCSPQHLQYSFANSLCGAYAFVTEAVMLS